MPPINRAGFLAALSIFVGVSAAAADSVTTFNSLALDAIRAERTSPPQAARALAITSIAVYDALNAIEPTHRFYGGPLHAPAGASAEAAAATAARDTLAAIFPGRAAEFDAALTTTLGSITDPVARDAGILLGRAAATRTLALRDGDGAGGSTPYTPSPAPGRWQPTAPGGQALLPHWGWVRPFSVPSVAALRPAGPPALTGADYAAAFDEVRRLGSADSAERTSDQTQAARFWADGAGTATPPGHWNSIAVAVGRSQGNSLTENARMLAMLNVGLADAGIACWDAKYAFDTWRPVTAIRLADADGNPLTGAEPAWTPLLPTPMFPEYVSGHSTFSGAAAVILAAFFNADNIPFTSVDDAGLGLSRSFSSFSHAADEAAVSRLFGGIHFGFSNADGLALGRLVGADVVSRHFTPVPAPSAAIALGAAAAFALRRRRPLR